MALSNSQYDAIMRVYNQRQFQDKRDQDQRVAEVFEKIPQVEALSDELAVTMAQAARKLLAGDRAAADRLKKDAEFLKEQKALYLKQNGYPADYLELQYVCPDCKDTGYADGKKCHCFRHMEIEILYDQSNIREVLERENFDTLSMEYYDRTHVDEKTGMTVYDYMSMMIRECKEYVENFKNEKGSILFTGNTGCGKTFLSNCIARELIRRYYSVVYLTATDMFDILAGYGQLVLHSSYVLPPNGKAVLFSGPSGIGKSTQAALWQQYAGADVINGDRTLIRTGDITAHGVFYSGTSGICKNVTAPIRAIVLLEQSGENTLRRAGAKEAFAAVLSQCSYYQWDAESAIHMTDLAAELVRRADVYRLSCRADEEAVRLLQNELFGG